MIAYESGSGVCGPKFMVPRHSRLTTRPRWPTWVYSMPSSLRPGLRSFGEPDPLARRVAERFRSAHAEAAANAIDELPEALAVLGEPLGDPALIEMAARLKAAACPSALSAAGADELFAGHPRYLRAARLPHSGRAGRAAGLMATIAPRR